MLIADVPGVSRDRLTISVKENKLYIEGKRKRKVVSSEDSFLIQNRRNGVFKRLVNLPLDSDPQSMTAKLEDGLLVLTIPRVKKVNGLKYITIASVVCCTKQSSPASLPIRVIASLCRRETAARYTPSTASPSCVCTHHPLAAGPQWRCTLLAYQRELLKRPL